MPTVDGVTFSQFMPGQKLRFRNIPSEVTDVRNEGVNIILEGDQHPRFVGADNYKAFSLIWEVIGKGFSQRLEFPVKVPVGGIFSIQVQKIFKNDLPVWKFSYQLSDGTLVIISGKDPHLRDFSDVEEAKKAAVKTVLRTIRLENL